MFHNKINWFPSTKLCSHSMIQVFNDCSDIFTYIKLETIQPSFMLFTQWPGGENDVNGGIAIVSDVLCYAGEQSKDLQLLSRERGSDIALRDDRPTPVSPPKTSFYIICHMFFQVTKCSLWVISRNVSGQYQALSPSPVSLKGQKKTA